MLTAKQAQEAYAGTLPVSEFIPAALAEQIEQNIRMAVLCRHQGATIEIDSWVVGGNLKRWLEEFGYTVHLVDSPDVGGAKSLHITWSSIVLP